MNSKAFKGYFFLSHSSHDLRKIRKIRNVIEEENGNPILFYLRCLDGDNPQGKDEKELKSLISREISARKKFIFCKSKYTTPPLASEWILWEKEEVTKLQQADPSIKIYELEIDNNDGVLDEAKRIVFIQDKVVVLSSIEVRMAANEIANFLASKNVNVDLRCENAEMRDEVTKWNGTMTKQRIEMVVEDVKDEGIAIIVSSSKFPDSTFVQMARAMAYKHHVFTINVDADNLCFDNIYDKVIELINS